MVKGVIYSLLRRYYKQNSAYSDYLRFAGLLYRRLLARGYVKAAIRPLFL